MFDTNDQSAEESFGYSKKSRVDVYVKLTFWADGDSEAEKYAQLLIDLGKIAMIDEKEEDPLDEYDIEYTEPAAL